MAKEKLCQKYALSTPKNGSVSGPSSAQKQQPTFLQIKHDLPYIFRTTMWAEYCPADLDTIPLTVPKKNVIGS